MRYPAGRLLGAVALMATACGALGACSGGSGGATATSTTSASTTTSTASSSGSGTSAPPSTASADACATPKVAVSGPPGQSTFVDNAGFVTALAWAPDGRLFFADRAGTIKIDSGGTIKTFATVPTVTEDRNGFYSERGLLGLTLSPNFATDHDVYAFYSRNDFTTQVVVRFTDCAGVASAPTTLITLPAGDDCCHKGGRLAFGPDGKLYVTLGDEHSVTADTVSSTSSVPQNTADVRGKILRYEPDGSIPSDNPFGASSPVWVAGLRNPFGIAFATDGATDGTDGGQAFVTSNGPTGDIGTPATGYDLAFRVDAGGVYQWPACYGYSHLVPGATSCLGRPEPEWSSEQSTIVPTGATWVDSKGPDPYAGHFVFCSQSGMRMFTPGSPHATLTNGPDSCHLDVKEGPDHALYFSDETKIYRLGAT